MVKVVTVDVVVMSKVVISIDDSGDVGDDGGGVVGGRQ